jgi:hypothetical protein
MTVATRPRNYLCTELHGGILGKTAILTRHAGKIIILKAQATAVFIRHQNVFNAEIAGVFLTETSSHTHDILCTVYSRLSAAGHHTASRTSGLTGNERHNCHELYELRSVCIGHDNTL